MFGVYDVRLFETWMNLDWAKLLAITWDTRRLGASVVVHEVDDAKFSEAIRRRVMRALTLCCTTIANTNCILDGGSSHWRACLRTSR